MFQQILLALWAIALAIGLSALFFIGANLLLDRTLSSDAIRDDDARSRRDSIRESIRPWIFIGPALLILGLYLVVPVIYTVILSMQNRQGEFIGLANYFWAFRNPGFQISIRNNILWLLVVPTFSTIFGLVIAYLTDRMWWRNIARSLIFLPMAISFVGASVIWRFIYDYRGSGQEIGLLNAVVTAFGGEPQAWIAMQPLNNFLLMAIMVWIQTGFAMVLLGAAIRGVPEDTIEAASMDGASDIQMFFKIVIPQVWGTIVVVWTTITVLVLKIFDVVLAMTNGQWETQVLANLMFDIMFRAGDFGRGSTVAVFIMIAVLPIMWWNVRQARKEMT